MSDIASDVREIKESKSKFGTKLPGNGNKAQELTLKELSYEQMIMGSIASLVWGVKNINKDTQVKTLLGRNNIFDIVKNIQTEIPTSFDNFYKKLDELITKLSNNIANNLTQFSNLLIIPKFDELIKAVEKSYKEKGSLKDSTTKILIDLKAADTIEQILKDFDALDGIVIFDNDNVNRVQDLLDRLDKLSKENIYLVIDTNLYDTIKELKELKIDIYDPTCLDSIKSTIDELKSEKIELFDSVNIDNLNELVNEINQKDKINIFDIESLERVEKLIHSIESLKENKLATNALTSIKSLLESIKDIKIEDINDDTLKLNNIISFINTGKTSINNLLNAIDSLGSKLNNKEHIEILSQAFGIIETLTKLAEGSNITVNKKFFKDLSDIVNPDKKEYINGIIENINDLADLSKDAEHKVEIVDNLITTVSNLGNLGFIKLIKSKIALMSINRFLVKDIGNLIKEIKTFDNIEQDTDKSFEALDHLFDSIIKLGDITISDKRKMAKNIIFIDKFLSDDIRNIIQKSIPKLEEGQELGFTVLEKTKGIIDALIGIADIDKNKLDIASEKIENLEDFIKDDVKELLNIISKSLGKEDYLQKLINKIDLTQDIFKSLGDMNDSIPSVMSLIKSNAKVMLLAIEFAFIEESFNTLAKLSKILKTKDKQFLSKRFDGTLDSIIEINGVLASINTKQGIKDILALDSELAYMYWCMDYLKEIAESYTKVLKFNEFKKTIQNIKAVVDSIEITKEDYKKLGSLTALLNVMYTLGQYASDKTTFDMEKFDEATNAIINGAVPFLKEFIKDSDLDKILKDLIVVNDKTLEKFDQIIKLIEKFDKLSKIAVLSKISNIGLKGIVQEAEYIKVIIGKFGDIDNKEIKKAEKSLNLFKKLVIMSAAILLAGALIMKFIKIQDLLAFTGTLAIFLFAVTGVFRLVAKALKPAMEGARGAVLLIAASALVMLAGSLVMNYVDFGNLLLFTTSLSIFLFAITGIFRLFSKGFEQALDGAKDAMLIVAASALIMLVGSRLVKPEDFLASLLFAFELGVFLAAIGLAFKLWEAFDSKAIMASAEDVCLIIGVSALALILGGLVTKYVGIADLLLFTLELTLLIAGTIGIFMAASKFTPGALESARDIAILIGVSGLVLILAGLLANHIKFGWLALFVLELAVLIGGVLALYAVVSMIPVQKYLQMGWELSLLVAASGLILILAGLVVKYIDLGSLFLFTLILGAFIGGILLIYSIASKGFKHAFKGAKEMAILIAASALILILGTLAVQKWIDIPSLIVFTLCLAGFIFAITYAYSFFGKQIKKAIVPAILLAILTAISGFVLIMGGKYFLDNPGLATAVLEFAGILVAYIAVMGGVCFLLGKFMAKIAMGLVAMALLLAVTALATSVIDSIAKVASQEGFLLNILKGVGAIALVIAAIGGIAFAAGALVMGPQALVFAAGVAVMATISGLALLAAQAVKNIAVAMMYMKAVEKFDPGIMIDNIKGFIAIAKEMEPIADSFSMIMKASIAIQMMSSALSSVAKTLKDWADLKIPVYRGTEIVGYETITGDMFPKAAENIKAVVTTLGQAIIDVYEAKPEMFDGPLFGLMDTPFIKVTKGLKTMGPMLTSIAKSIIDWADLKIPVYRGTEIVGYETITGDMFPKAAENIKQVIVTLGQAVIDVYNEKPEMFDGPLFGLMDTPFIKVTKGLKTMGPMLTSIAKGVKDWADFKIPIYKGTEIVGYDTITAGTMTTAAKNIKSVIKTLGEAIIETYDECEKNEKTQGMFDPQGFLGFGKSKFARVTKAFKTMGPMLSSIADAISKWAELKIPVYKGTEIVEYKTIKDAEFGHAAENIKKVLKCIGEALVEVVEKNPKIFGEDIFTDGPAIVAANAMKLMGETLNLTATAVASYASGTFPLFDKDGKYVKDIVVKDSDYDKAAQAINKVLVCIGNALTDVVKNNDIFNDGLFSDAPAIKAAEAIKGMSEALNNSVTAISKLAELDLNELHTALDPMGPEDNIYHRLNDLLTFTVEIYRLFVSEDSSMATTGKVSHWWRSDTVEKMSFAEYLDEHNGDVEDANDALGTFTSMLSKMLEKYADIGKLVNDNKDSLKLFEGGYNSDIYKYLNDSMSSVSAMVRLLTGEDKLDLFEQIEDNEDDIIDGIKSTTNICETMLEGVLDLKKLFDEISGFNLYMMIPMINSFDSCVQALSKIGKQGEENTGNIKLSLPAIDAAVLSAQIAMYSTALDMIIKVNEHAKEAGEEGYNILRDGILKVYAATQQIEDNKIFKQHVKDLQDYVKAINSIKLNNISSLKNFVDSMNELSKRLGNLDNLTDAVGNKLSQVLYELVLQLRKAEATINNAHELQEKRKRLMDESIQKINSIMDHHMIVEISQMQEDSTSTEQTGTIGGTTIDNAPTGTDNTPPTSTETKPNPEETPAARGTEGSRVSQQKDAAQLKDVLTFGKFKEYMEKQYLNKIRNSG